MDRRSEQLGEWDELWRGARLAVVAVVSAVVTAAGVIAAGGALIPAQDESPAEVRLTAVSDR